MPSCVLGQVQAVEASLWHLLSFLRLHLRRFSKLQPLFEPSPSKASKTLLSAKKYACFMQSAQLEPYYMILYKVYSFPAHSMIFRS